MCGRASGLSHYGQKAGDFVAVGLDGRSTRRWLGKENFLGH